MPQHDETLRLYFKHKIIMQSLLRGMGTRTGLPKPWLDAVNLNYLIPLSTMFVSDALKATYGDSAWFAPFYGEEEAMAAGIYRGIVFHQEFQSTVELDLPFRTESYSVQLQHDLWRVGLTPKSVFTPVVSIVIFNGPGGWTASLDTGDLYEPIGGVPVSSVTGSKHHLLLDMCQMNPGTLPNGELISCIIRQQVATDGRQVWDVLNDVYRLIPGDENKNLRRVFHQAAVNSPRIPENVEFSSFEEFEKVHIQGGDVTTLLDHNMEVWCNQMVDQGRAEGLVEGERRVLLRLTASLFGADIAEHLAVLLDRIGEPEHLANLSEVLIKCDTGEEFLSRVERDLG